MNNNRVKMRTSENSYTKVIRELRFSSGV